MSSTGSWLRSGPATRSVRASTAQEYLVKAAPDSVYAPLRRLAARVASRISLLTGSARRMTRACSRDETPQSQEADYLIDEIYNIAFVPMMAPGLKPAPGLFEARLLRRA